MHLFQICDQGRKTLLTLLIQKGNACLSLRACITKLQANITFSKTTLTSCWSLNLWSNGVGYHILGTTETVHWSVSLCLMFVFLGRTCCLLSSSISFPYILFVGLGKCRSSLPFHLRIEHYNSCVVICLTWFLVEWFHWYQYAENLSI